MDTTYEPFPFQKSCRTVPGAPTHLGRGHGQSSGPVVFGSTRAQSLQRDLADSAGRLRRRALVHPHVWGIHFYNEIDGVRWNLTVSQFDDPIPYEDRPMTRAEALADATPARYRTVCERLGMASADPV